MRTTLTIDQDVFVQAKQLARAEGSSIGRVLSRLARQGLQVGERVVDGDGDGLATFSVPAQAEPLTPAHVRHVLDEP